MTDFWNDWPGLEQDMDMDGGYSSFDSANDGLGLFPLEGNLDTTFGCNMIRGQITVSVLSLEVLSDHRAAGQKILRPALPRNYVFTNAAPQVGGVSPAGRAVNSLLGDGQAPYQGPEWVRDPNNGNQASHPTCHPKGIQTTISVVFRIHVPADRQLDGSITRIVGFCLAPGLSFHVDLGQQYWLNVGDNDVQVQLQSTQALVDEVTFVWDQNIAWTLTVGGEDIYAGLTGPLRLYLTYGPPTGPLRTNGENFAMDQNLQHITEPRLRLAIDAVLARRGDVVFNHNDAKAHVDAIFRYMSNDLQVRYSLGYRWPFEPPDDDDYVNTTYLASGGNAPTMHEYLWLVAAGDAYGECHNAAAGFYLMCKVLGIPGAFELGYMFPWPSRTDAHPFPYRLGDGPGPQPGPRPVPHNAPHFGFNTSIKGRYGVDRRVQYKRNLNGTWRDPTNLTGNHLVVGFRDGNDRTNKFEGVLCYQNQYLYGIGEMILDTEATADLNASVFFAEHQIDGVLYTVTHVGTLNYQDDEVEGSVDGSFRLFFGRSDARVFVAAPYGGVVAYTRHENADHFYWHD